MLKQCPTEPCVGSLWILQSLPLVLKCLEGHLLSWGQSLGFSLKRGEDWGPPWMGFSLGKK